MLQQLVRLPSTVWLIGLISLCNDSASELLYPLVPLYLSTVLMAGPRSLGIIEGVAEASASLLKLVSGVIVDRTRRTKPWIIAGYALAGLSRPLIAFANQWGFVLVLRFADRVGKGLRTSPRDALLAASVSAERRGLAFGLHRAMDNAGAVIGPLLAALFLEIGTPLQTIFLWTLAPGLITLLLALSIHEPHRSLPTQAQPFRWSLSEMPTPYRRYLLAVGLFTLGNSSNMFLLLRAGELGIPHYQVPLLWAGVSAVATLFSAPLSGLSDKIGRVRLIVAGWSVYAFCYLGMGLVASNGVALVALFALYGLFLAATEGSEKAFVADLVPPALAGTAYGWFNLVTGALLLPASLIFGWLYQWFGPLMAFGFSGACAVLATLMIACGFARSNPLL